MRDPLISPDPLPDLTACDREPIHIPSLIQPHGVLMVLTQPDLVITQVSANADLLGRAAADLLGQPLATVLNAEDMALLHVEIEHASLDDNPLYLGTVTPIGVSQRFDVIAHQIAGQLVLECELVRTDTPTRSTFAAVRSAATVFQRAQTLADFCTAVVAQVRLLTGFDRVMLYQFDHDGAGSVIAEARRDDLESFLALRYPAADIPQQARRLYILNWLRLIPDRSYVPVPLLPPRDAQTDAPLDMSYAILRSVSPVHLEYLANMGVMASMSISVVRDGTLWGLIACHHEQPKYLPYDVRAACEYLGQMIALQLPAKEAFEDVEYRSQLQTRQSAFVTALSGSTNIVEALSANRMALLDLFTPNGAAIVWDDYLDLIGATPALDDVARIADWLEETIPEEIFATDALAERYPPAQPIIDRAAGILALRLEPGRRRYLLWFRPEVARTVAWAGEPVKVLADGANSDDGSNVRISPRQSFARWQQTVQGHSQPWSVSELAVATQLRVALSRVILQPAEALARLNAALERSNRQLDAFAALTAHDLREPLRGIQQYAEFLREDYAALIDDEGNAKLQTIRRLATRMTDLIESLLYYARVENSDVAMVPADLGAVVAEVCDLLHVRIAADHVTIRIPRPLPVILCDHSGLMEVYNNLLTNALKYTESSERWIELGYREATEDAPLALYVRDNGIGIPQTEHQRIFGLFTRLHERDAYGGGSGIGLLLVQRIIERHGGRIWVESTPGSGTTFWFTLA